MDKENARNTIVFVVCAVALMIAYQIFILGPHERERQAQAHAQAVLAQQNPLAAAAPGASIFVDRASAAKVSPRVPLETPAVKGSVALMGGRIDDLYLKGYKETLAPNSPPVELFRPEGAKQAYFADFGWTGPADMPRSKTVWTLVSGTTLAPGQPVTLSWDNGKGLVFTRTISVDERYMFTVANTVANNGAQPIQLAPYASVQRQGLPEVLSANVHEGAVGYLAERLKLIAFKKWTKTPTDTTASTGGWLGVTDKYWLAAVIPDQKEAVQGAFRVSQVNGVDVYEANYVAAARTVAPGAKTTETTRLFAGAKDVSVLQDYQTKLGIPQLDNAVDWGLFWFLTRPIFWLVEQLHKLIPGHNFGLSILALTVVIRLLFFPLANKSYESVTKMKKLQPQMEELKKKFKDDPAKQQQETMALYQREKINPLAGCLPVLFQLPVFYALYKMLSVTIEMRHAPFVGWIHDLSAPDPTTIWNLFGLIPWDPGTLPLVGGLLVGMGTLHIGIWPIIYGLSMWLSTSMSPMPSTDPTQKLIFQLFPVVFTVMLAHSPVGLVIYWSWSSILTVLQQYVIMRRFKVDNPIDDIITRFRGRSAAAKS